MRMGEYGIFFEIEKGVPFNDVHVFGKTKKNIFETITIFENYVHRKHLVARSTNSILKC